MICMMILFVYWGIVVIIVKYLFVWNNKVINRDYIVNWIVLNDIEILFYFRVIKFFIIIWRYINGFLNK